MDMNVKSQLVKLLLNTTINDTKTVREAQKELENCEESNAYPIVLIDIIGEYANSKENLDLIAILALHRFIRGNYAGKEDQEKLVLCESILKLLENHSNPKIINETIMILKLIITIDFPNSATLKLIVENFTDKRLVALENFTNSNKFIYLKLVYKSLSTVYKEKGKNNDNNALILHEIMKNYIVSCLSNLVKSLKYDSELIISSIRNLTNSVEDLSKLEDLLNKLDENYFLQSAKYIMKIFTLFHIVSKEKSLGGNELIIMAQTFHNFYEVVCSLLLTSELMKNSKIIQQLNGILTLLYVTEKFLMKALENFGTNIDEVIMIFQHFLDMYFKEDHTLSFGEKIFQFDQLIHKDYLEEVCQSEVFTVIRKKEQKLVTNSLNTFSLIIKHFLFPNLDNNPEKEEIMTSIQNCFVSNLDVIIGTLMNKYLIIDPEDIYKLRTDPEEFFHEIDDRNDDTIEIREAVKTLFNNFDAYLSEDISAQIAATLEDEIINEKLNKMETYKQVLRRESSVFLLKRMFPTFKGSIEYEKIVMTFLEDLNIEGDPYDFLKFQMMDLIEVYVTGSYYYSKEVVEKIFIQINNLIPNYNKVNIALILSALRILLKLIEKEPEVINFIQDIIQPIFYLIKEVEHIQSKIDIFEFFYYSIIGIILILSFTLEGKVSDYYLAVWEICNISYFSCKDLSADTMNLKSKIINIVIKLIECQGINYKEMKFIATILQESIIEDEETDELLYDFKAGVHLLAILSSVIDFSQIDQESESIIAKVLELFFATVTRKHSYLAVFILIIESFVVTGNENIEGIIGRSFIKYTETLLAEIKESAMSYVFDCIELFLIKAKNFRKEFFYFLLESITKYIHKESDFTYNLLQDCLRILARLAYEDVDCLYLILNEIESKSGIKQYKYLLLTKFYDIIKDETVYSGYHEKKHFSFYTLSILSYALQELENTEGLDFGMINLEEKLLINDVKDLLFVLCRSLSETYDYDIKQLEYIPSKMHMHIELLFNEDPFIKGNEMKFEHFKSVIAFLNQDQMRKQNIYLAAKNLFVNSKIIQNNNEYKNVIINNFKCDV